MSETETNLCRNWGLSEETIEHLFSHCVKVKEFLPKIYRWIESLTGTTCQFTIQEVLLGIIQVDNHSEKFNLLLILLKDYIFKVARKGSIFNTTAFSHKLYQIYIEQEYLATINSQLPTFLRKWALVKDVVHARLANTQEKNKL